VGFVISPFHRCWIAEGDEDVKDVGHEWEWVNQLVLAHIPC